MSTLDPTRFDALTFDCYGTLIDWETGIDAALTAILRAHGASVPRDRLLEEYASAEAGVESGGYVRYRRVLAESGREVCARNDVDPSDAELAAFGGSVVDWPAFPDSPDALARLQRRFKLGVLTNCDDDLFAGSARRLGIHFDWIVTAQQAGSYKPDRHNFEVLFERLGLPRERILHVAQSLFHDHVPAKELGLTTVWVNRRHDKPGAGATPPAEARPDLVVPDLATLADLLVGTAGA